MPQKSNIHVLIETLNQTPCSDLLDREFALNFIKFGSYASIIKNKQLNVTSLVIEIIQDKNIQLAFCDYFACESLPVALSLIFDYNPHLAKSKSIKDSIKKIYSNGIRKRKKNI